MLSALIVASQAVAIFASEWSYKDIDDWVNLPGSQCGGLEQSPINIDTKSVSRDCPLTTTDEPTLKWNIQTTNDAYQFVNDGHTLKFTAVNDANEDFGEYTKLNTNENTVARLENLFVTPSGEHRVYCLDNVHFHWSLSNSQGSEHTVNGVETPLEAHFVHFSCDYPDIGAALAAAPEDPLVLAVVGVFFELGDDNPFFERMLTFTDYFIEEDPEGTIQYGFDLMDLVPNTAADFWHYDGSLTTPPCLEIVNWHVLTARNHLSARQLKYLRWLRNDKGHLLAPNFRPPQFNQNPVFICSAEDFDPFTIIEDEDKTPSVWEKPSTWQKPLPDYSGKDKETKKYKWGRKR